jgi:ubiquinone/menaquinone biosynthesis C-methylase UbiE
MTARTQEALAVAQFGEQASAYVSSAVHAAGADLAALASLAEGHPDARVLDLGCGGGHVAYAVAPHVAEVVACDLSEQMLQAVAETAAQRGLANLHTKLGPAERLPFVADEFDLVLSRYSAHHWRDLDAGLREAVRVLVPGGRLGIVDVVSPGWPAHDTFLQAVEVLRDTSHVRNRSRAEWAEALARAGLDVAALRSFRVRLVFADWIARMRTPPTMASAIRALQDAVSDAVRSHFAIEPDGSFTIDVALMVCAKPLG